MKKKFDDINKKRVFVKIKLFKIFKNTFAIQIHLLIFETRTGNDFI